MQRFKSWNEPRRGASKGSSSTEGRAPAWLKAYTGHLLQSQTKHYPFQFNDKLIFFLNILQSLFPSYSSYFFLCICATLSELRSCARKQSDIGNKHIFCQRIMFCMFFLVKPWEMVYPNKNCPSGARFKLKWKRSYSIGKKAEREAYLG